MANSLTVFYILWCSVDFLGTASSLQYLKMYIKICLWPRIQKCFRYSERIRNDLVVSITKYVMKIVATTAAVEKGVSSIGAYHALFIAKVNSVDIFSFIGTPEGSEGF